MAYIFIAIVVLIIIGAFKINVILGLIALLGSIFYFGGGFSNQTSRAKTTTIAKPTMPSRPTEPYYERRLHGGRGTLEDAIALAKEGGMINTSRFERELNVSYKQAADYLDEMEKQGIVGPQDGARPRQLLAK